MFIDVSTLWKANTAYRFGYNNLITVPIISSNGTAVRVRNVSIVLINCQSIYDKCEDASDFVQDTDFDDLVIVDSWLISYVSKYKILEWSERCRILQGIFSIC